MVSAHINAARAHPGSSHPSFKPGLCLPCPIDALRPFLSLHTYTLTSPSHLSLSSADLFPGFHLFICSPTRKAMTPHNPQGPHVSDALCPLG